MKLRRLLGCFSLLLFFSVFLPASSSAALLPMDIGGDIIVHDTVNELWWVSDLTLFTNKTETEQDAIIAGLNSDRFAGITTWGLSTISQGYDLVYGELYSFGLSGGPIDTLFTPTGTLEQDNKTYTLFSGRNEAGAWGSLYSIYQSQTDPTDVHYNYTYFSPSDERGAWVVSSTGPAPVPEPATMLLLGFGLAGLAGLKRKIKKS